jgi:hypothetical protein
MRMPQRSSTEVQTMDLADCSSKTVNRSYDVSILLGYAVLGLFAMAAIRMASTAPGSVDGDVFVMAAMP